MGKKIIPIVILTTLFVTIATYYTLSWHTMDIPNPMPGNIPITVIGATQSSSGILTDTGVSIGTGALILSGETFSGSGFSGGIIQTPQKIKSVASKNCLFDICLDPNHPIIQEKDSTRIQAYEDQYDDIAHMPLKPRYASKIEPSKTYTSIIKINTQKEFASRTKDEGMGSNEISITKNGGYFLRIDKTLGCAGFSTKQKLLTIDGKESNISHFVNTYPKSFSIGNIVYNFSGSSLEYSSVSLYTPEQIVYTGSISIHDDVSKIIHDFAIDQKFLAKNYILEFREIPGVKILYTSSLLPSDRLVSLSDDPVWKSKNIKNNELLDLGETKRILGYYNNAGRGVTMKNSKNGYEDMITDSGVLSEQLPIFRVVPVDEQGNYLLYTTSGYDITQFAELCKPLVYIYSSLVGNNTLSVDLPAGGYFSKLIPHFTNARSWDFQMNPSGRIDIGDKNFDYLYYSAKVPGYKWNTDGWQVYGADMDAFFREKLPKTGMNKREMDDFMSFWKHNFDKDARYFVSFKFDNAIDPYASLSFAKHPDTLHRILLEAYPMQESSYNDHFLWPKVGEKFDMQLLQSFIRSGKMDVLEWGGVVFDHDKNTYIVR